MTVQPPPIPRSRFSPLSILVAIAGAAVLVFSVRQVGWNSVLNGLGSVGLWLIVVIALGAARMAFRARAWMICASAEGEGGAQLPFREAFAATLSADALGNLTPLGLLASEPAKVMLVRAHVPALTGVASVVVENASYSASVLLMLLGGTWVFLHRAQVPSVLQQAGQVVIALSVVALVAGVWMARVRPAVLTYLAGMIARVRQKPGSSTATLQALERSFYGVLGWPAGTLARIAGWQVAFHVAAVAEVWLILRLLPGGGATTIVDAFLLETTGRFITVVFKFIPYRLGVDEFGSGSVSQLLGLGSTTGVTLALVRRLRIICLNAVGLALLARPRPSQM